MHNSIINNVVDGTFECHDLCHAETACALRVPYTEPQFLQLRVGGEDMDRASPEGGSVRWQVFPGG